MGQGCRVWFSCRDDRRWLISACAWCLSANGRERTERFPRLIINSVIKNTVCDGPGAQANREKAACRKLDRTGVAKFRWIHLDFVL